MSSFHSARLGVFLTALLTLQSVDAALLAAEPVVLDLWPAEPPDETLELPPEADETKPSDRLIAGRRIIKLGNVSTPQIAVYRPTQVPSTRTAVVICPGGGHHILAYDLEGTEVAEWLNSLGVTAILLKYRVPYRHKEKRWLAAVQDAQRAMSLVRSQASRWDLDTNRIGMCGFSAGGQTAALTSLLKERQYSALDDIDRVPYKPGFALLIYPGGLTNSDHSKLDDRFSVGPDVPPMFFVHAFDDNVSVQNSLLLASALRGVGGSAELHVFASGGHGYGLRPTEEPVTHWPEQAGVWLRRQGFLPSSDAK